MSAAEQPDWTGGYELPVHPFVPPPERDGGEVRRDPIAKQLKWPAARAAGDLNS